MTASSPAMFSVGICLSEESLPVSPASPSDNSNNSNNSNNSLNSPSSPPYLREIMHNPPAKARPFRARVRYQASPACLAAAFNLPEYHIRHTWLAPLQASENMNISPPLKPTSHKAAAPILRFTPQSVLDPSAIPDALSESLSSKDSTTTHPHPTHAACHALQLDPLRFAPLFLDDGKAENGAILFVHDLIRRLSVVVQPQHAKTHGNPSGSRGCGLCRMRSHDDLQLVCQNQGLRKTRHGLYRTACTTGFVSGARGTRASYFEVVIVDDVGAGGVCIGVATYALALNRLVGSDVKSVGLHSSGALVHKAGRFDGGFAAEFRTGDRVGCVVLGESPGRWWIRFRINGVEAGPAAVPLQTGDQEALHGAVSVYKKDSKVVFLCCEEDWTMANVGSLQQQLGCPVEPLCTVQS